MTNRHIAQAKHQQRKGIDHEQKGLFSLAVSFYQIARNRWRQTPNSKDHINWCNGRISHCKAMILENDDNE